MRHNEIISLVLFLGFIVGCQTTDPVEADTFKQTHRPVFDEVSYPEDNTYTPERWQLGKLLFYEEMLSVDTSISCASCHKAELAFSDNRATSPGVKDRPGKRNSPGLTNVAYHPYYTREGGVPSLEMQVLVPLQEHNEFDFNIVDAGERLKNDSTYRRLSQLAYGRAPDYYVVTRALATFERSFISDQSKLDRSYVDPNTTLTDSERAGMELFYSDRTSCASCHGGFNFTDYSFKNNGLYVEYNDPGRMRLTGETSDQAVFKVPSLRNIELTGPYMHDGSVETLEQVIEHYNTGGKPHPNKSDLIRPLNLTSKEKSDLKAFLLCLTDREFTTNPIFKK